MREKVFDSDYIDDIQLDNLRKSQSFEDSFRNYNNIQKINEEFYKRAFSYLRSDVIDRNYKKSFKLFKKLSEQGDAKSQYHLGEMYTKGLYVEKDDEKAKNYFIKSFYTLSRLAEDGDFESEYYLSLMFLNGYG